MLKFSLLDNRLSLLNGERVIMGNITLTFNRYKLSECEMVPVCVEEDRAVLHFDDKENEKLSFDATLCGKNVNGSFILSLDTTLTHDHTQVRSTFEGDDSAIISFDSFNAPVMANYQYSPWWTAPCFADSIGGINDKSLSVLVNLQDEYLHFYPMCDGNFRTCLKGEGDRAALCVSIRSTGYSHISGVVMSVGVGDDPYKTVKDNMANAFGSVAYPIPMKDGREDIDALSLLGWCTYDAFYREVTHDKIIEKLKEFKQNNIPIRLLLIDSGWFVHNEDGTKGNSAVDLHANPEKFPKGIKGLIEEAKRDYGIEKVGIWHGLSVIWQGIEKGSPAYNELKDCLVELDSGFCFPAFEREKAYRFYSYWHSYLAGEGIDFIKVDLQGEMPKMAENILDVNSAMKNIHAGFEQSAAEHFSSRVINCMGMGQENVQSRILSGVARNSNDFFPNKENGFADHFLENAYNSVYHGNIYYCDFDMWWTQHESAHQSALLRAVSGGPVYVSDKIGCTSPEELVKLADKRGVLYRCDNNGCVCRDNLFSNPTQAASLAKMFNMSGSAGLVAAFNIDSEGNTVSGSVSPHDVEGIEGDKFLCCLQSSGKTAILERDGEIELSLSKNEGELAIFVPIRSGFAMLGLADKYVSPATVCEKNGEYILREGGRFVFMSDAPVTSVTANGAAVEFTAEGAVYTAYIPDCEGEIAVKIN